MKRDDDTTDPVIRRVQQDARENPKRDWAAHVMVKMLDSQNAAKRAGDQREAEALRLFAYVTLASLGLTALVVALILGSDLRLAAPGVEVEAGHYQGGGVAPTPVP